jgi:hypothetical protein
MGHTLAMPPEVVRLGGKTLRKAHLAALVNGGLKCAEGKPSWPQ